MSSISRFRWSLCHKFLKHNKSNRFICSSGHQKEASLNPASPHSGDADTIIIPNRIDRSPTDILDALASTVQRDTYGPMYKYIDDPATLPVSVTDKKAFSLANAAGKRAAQYVLKKWPQLFSSNPMDPMVEVPEVYSADFGAQSDESTEEGLRERIQLRLVTDSYASYQRNKEAGTQLSSEIIHDLFDLLCVHNSTDEDPLLEEESVFRVSDLGPSPSHDRNTWKDSGPAEEMFKEMENPTSRACCSLIKGRAKYFQLMKSLELFREMRLKNMKFDIETYNAVIMASCLTTQRSDDKISLIRDLFEALDKQGLRPTLETFNTTFNALGRCERGGILVTFNFCNQLLSEMYAQGLEPTLATWFHLLKIIYREDNCQNRALYEIMDRLEGRDLVAHDPHDYEFFACAISKAHNNLKDLDLTYKINNLLNHGNNYQLLGDNLHENIYYNLFFKTLCTFEQIETIMEYYDRAVPHWFTPNHSSIHDLIEALDLNEGYSYIPKLWTDLFRFQYERFPMFTSPLCGIMARRTQEASLQKQYREMVFSLYDNVRFEVMRLEEKGRIQLMDQLKLISGELLGRMCQVCINSGDYELTKEIFQFYLDYRSKISRQFDQQDLESLVDLFIKDKDFNNSMEVLSMMSGWAYKCTDRTAEKMKSLLDLTPEQEHIVDNML